MTIEEIIDRRFEILARRAEILMAHEVVSAAELPLLMQEFAALGEEANLLLEQWRASESVRTH